MQIWCCCFASSPSMAPVSSRMRSKHPNMLYRPAWLTSAVCPAKLLLRPVSVCFPCPECPSPVLSLHGVANSYWSCKVPFKHHLPCLKYHESSAELNWIENVAVLIEGNWTRVVDRFVLFLSVVTSSYALLFFGLFLFESIWLWPHKTHVIQV